MKALYKNRTYRLDWVGSTKYGRRAKLSFMDGSKTFWVNAGLITELSGNHSSGEMCAECGDRVGVVDAPDSSGIMAKVCRRCAKYSKYERSYM